MTVTIVVPPSAPPEIRRPQGDAAGADTLAQDLYRAAGRYDEFGDRAATLRELSSAWWGSAYEAYRSASATASDEHVAMAATVKRVGHAVTAYADELRDRQREWEDLVGRKQVLDRERRALLQAIGGAADAAPELVAQLRDRAADLRRQYADLVADHDAFQRRVRDDETQLQRAFRSGTRLEDALSESGGMSSTGDDVFDRPGAPGSGAGPDDVNAWWEGLSEAERDAAIAAHPELIGSADGLPASARDEANRILLEADRATLETKAQEGTISREERQVLDNARETEKALRQVEGYVDPTSGEKPGGTLWLYDPTAFDGDGRVAVAVGDLDTADDVSIQTPGIMTEMTDVTGYAREATRLYESARYNGDDSSVATMFWLGYDTPEAPWDLDTVTTGRADDGGQRLADAVDGLRASRSDDPAHMTAIGNSYGSTTTAYAATEHELTVDDVALVGSPGAGPAETAGEFSVGEDHVFTGRNSRDLVAFFGDEGAYHNPGGLGVDPSSEGFGATRFEAESVDRGDHRTISDHLRYYDRDSESLYNLGLIVDGHGADVNEAAHSHDPWWRWADDPEEDRAPTGNEPGHSDTTPG